MQDQQKPSRRGFFFGAAATGAAAAAIVALPRLATTEVQLEAVIAPPENGGGYRLSEHVKSYYKTARI